MASAKVGIGLGYGDEGKGTMVDYLARDVANALVVRFSGGSQAGHNVVTKYGEHHCFSQFGSGAFSNSGTLLSRFMMVDPVALAHETAALRPHFGTDPLARHFIDERCPIITPFHVAANLERERQRGADAHGTCGKGIGELADDLQHHKEEVLRASEICSPALAADKLRLIQQRKREAPGATNGILCDASRYEEIARAYAELAPHFNIISADQAAAMIASSDCIFEGSQGVLLDEKFGLQPHTTWSNVTAGNAVRLALECGIQRVEIIGVTRTYGTRHGAGPFLGERLPVPAWPGEHNGNEGIQGRFRSGALDLGLLRHAATCCPDLQLTSVALTHADIFERCQALPFTGEDGEASEAGSIEEMAELVRIATGAEVRYLSSGPTAQHKIRR